MFRVKRIRQNVVSIVLIAICLSALSFMGCLTYEP